MSDRVTLPVNVADTGPTLVVTLAVSSVSDSLVSSWQPGMALLRISGSFSASHTFSRGAAIRYSPVMSMARAPLDIPRGS